MSNSFFSTLTRTEKSIINNQIKSNRERAKARLATSKAARAIQEAFKAKARKQAAKNKLEALKRLEKNGYFQRSEKWKNLYLTHPSDPSSERRHIFDVQHDRTRHGTNMLQYNESALYDPKHTHYFDRYGRKRETRLKDRRDNTIIEWDPNWKQKFKEKSFIYFPKPLKYKYPKLN